jgi:glycosyltransferase involved in cell wall biosynthesis
MLEQTPKKILFIASHRPNRSPSQRFRFEQYFDFFKKNNIDFKLSYIIDEKSDEYLYAKGLFFRKFIILLNSIFIRWRDSKELKKYDLIFIQREALMIGSTWFERKVKKTGAPFIFDFDDSIWLLDTSDGNKKWEWLKNPDKTKSIIALADKVIAGNKYLADYASTYNCNVEIIPTTVDTEKFYPDYNKRNKDKVVIGWSGSITTIKHFKQIIPILEIIKNKYVDRVIFRVVGDETFINENLNIEGEKWRSDEEVETLNSFDIGIMPLPDDKWAQGKCGLKGLTYMALEIPTIMSPVGVNKEIIQHGSNGFLCSTVDEWINVLSSLIENSELRINIGKKARLSVEKFYSVKSQQDRYLNIIKTTISKN